MRYLLCLLLLMTACSRTPQFNAPDGETGHCGNGVVYRYDQKQLSVLTLDFGDRLIKSEHKQWQIAVPAEPIAGELRVFEAASPNAACTPSTIKPKAIWKLLNGKLKVETDNACATAEHCQASIELQNATFGFELDGKAYQLALDPVQIKATLK